MIRQIATSLIKKLKSFSGRFSAGLINRISSSSFILMSKVKEIQRVIDNNPKEIENTDFEHIEGGSLIINWLIPDVGQGSGGHINIFRFANLLNKFGAKNRFYIYPFSKYNQDQLFVFINSNYLQASNFQIYSDSSLIQESDITFATSWQTAYYVSKIKNTKINAYFIQDFEPFFYPIGSYYCMAEHSYRLGLLSITAGDWLKNKLKSEFGAEAFSYSFSYDKDLYYRVEAEKIKKKKIFFYTRPFTSRRLFEIGVLALDKVKKEYRDSVEIIFAGWNAKKINLPFDYINMKIVGLSELKTLYSQIDCAIILSATNCSLLPLEVMACKGVVISNIGPNNEWLLKNYVNAVLCKLDVNDLYTKIKLVIDNDKLRNEISETGYRFAAKTDWEEEVRKVHKYLVSRLDNKHYY